MQVLFFRGILAAMSVAILAPPLPASAAPQTPAATAASAAGPGVVPSARVGRVSLASGKVELRGPGEQQWSSALINDPVATGTALRTDPQARAEIRIGADTIDLDRGTEITIARLNPAMAEIAVRRGRIDLDIRRFDSGETVQIGIPRGEIRLLRAGRYDVDVAGADQPVRIAAYTGAARFSGGGVDLAIKAGDRVLLSAAGPIAPTTEPASGDEFAVWCGVRAVDDSKLAAPYFVSREMTGYAALDGAGSWRATDTYGEVWIPKTLPADWAPYRYGHWRWLAPWGWSWVDEQPWGFATTHYGRWLFADGQWSWVPGQRTAHPVWAPAVVAFLGTPGVGLSYADGPGPAIAWFPLAPGEIYWPSYTDDVDYIRAINSSNVADISGIRVEADGEAPAKIANAHFANREFASVVPRPIFIAGGPVAPMLVTIPHQRLRNAPAIMGSPRIGPAPAPTPVRLAVAPPVRGHPAPLVAAKAARGANWAGIVNAAPIRARHFQEAARVRLAHLRLVAYDRKSPLRHTLVLRVARADHAPPHSEARKRVIRR